MDVSVYLFLALLLVVGLLRLVELRISKRHQNEMSARGAVKVDEPKFRWMVLLHTSVLLGAALEVVLLRRPFILWLGAPMIVVFLAANAVRWWVIRSLGSTGTFKSWIHAPRRGDLWTFSLRPASKLCGGVCGDAGSSADSHGVDHRSGGSHRPYRVLAQRLSTEERVLFANPDYRAAMTGKSRFLPGLF